MTMRSGRTITALKMAVLAATALAVPVQARDRTGAKAVDEIAACRTITVDTERLACFDRTASALVAARETGDLLVMDRARVVERKRQRFGLAMDDGAVFGGGAEDEATAVREVDTTIRAVASGGYAKYNLTLANGMVWQTLDPVRFAPRADQKIHLEKGLLGSFKARIGDRESVKVKRLQ